MEKIFKNCDLTRPHLIGIYLKWVYSGFESIFQEETTDRASKLQSARMEMKRMAMLMPQKKKTKKRKAKAMKDLLEPPAKKQKK